jgi:hypothetical protein
MKTGKMNFTEGNEANQEGHFRGPSFPWFASVKIWLLCALCVLCGKIPAQTTNRITPAATAVMVNSNGAVVEPANFFAANSNSLNAVVSGGSGGGLSTNLAPARIYIGNSLSNATAQAVGGDFTLSTNGTGTLTATGTAGTYAQATFDSKGRETSGTTVLPLNAGGTGQTGASAALTALGGASLTGNNVLSGINVLNNTGNLISGIWSNASTGGFLNITLTNVNNQPVMLMMASLSQQTNTAINPYITSYSPTPFSSSSGGWGLAIGGTNPTYNTYTGTAFSVLPNGQTNYIYDVIASAFNGVGAQYAGLNSGTVGVFNDPAWPFYLGGFVNGFGAADYLFWNPTNGIVYFPTLGAGTGDPRSTSFGCNTAYVDEAHSTLWTSNLVVQNGNMFASQGSAGFGNEVTVGSTNVNSNERLLVEAAGTSFGPSTNYAEVMIRSTSGNDGPSLNLTANGGSAFNIVSTGSGDLMGANCLQIYSFANGQVELGIDSSGNLSIPAGLLKLGSTNSTPSNTNGPKAWVSIIVGGNTYKLPLYQ